MARVLWLGDAGCHTGFARVTHSIGDRLVRDYGHEVSVLATNYQGDYWPTHMHLYRPTKFSPTDVYGQTRIVEMLGEVMPDVVVALNDPLPILKFLFDNKHDKGQLLLKSAPVIAYIPIDGHNYPPVTEILGKVTTRIAMTDFGARQMPGSKAIYHGVDTETYRPVSKASPMRTSTGVVVSSKKEAKAAFGYDPDSFLVLRVDRNSHRKNYADTWKALVPVMKRHEDVIVHFHCMAVGDDYNLRELISREPDIAKRIRFPDRVNSWMGWPEQDLAILYNAADVFVSTSWGEGFGLTIAEALASGVPVVAQDVSAITEVVGPGGILIQPMREVTVPMGHDQWLPNVPAFTEAIEHLYTARGSRRKMGEAARKHIVDTYSWDTATAGFDGLINDLTQRSSSGSEAGTNAGDDPGREVQHRDQGDDRQGGRGRPTDAALHSIIDG